MLPNLCRKLQPYGWNYLTVLAVLAKEREVVRDRARNWGHGGFYKSESTHFLYAGIIWDERNKDMFCGAASGLITYLTMESGRRIIECSCLRSLWRWWWEKYTWTEKKWIKDEGEAVRKWVVFGSLSSPFICGDEWHSSRKQRSRSIQQQQHTTTTTILLRYPF